MSAIVTNGPDSRLEILVFSAVRDAANVDTGAVFSSHALAALMGIATKARQRGVMDM